MPFRTRKPPVPDTQRRMLALSVQPESNALPAREAGARAQAPSFDSIYDTHVDRVFRMLRRIGVPESSLEDAVQDVFITAFRRMDSFEGRSSLSTWLCGVATQTARNYRRHARRHPETPTEGAGEDAPTSAPSPERELETSEALRVLLALLDELDEDKREVFVLVELEQIPVPEIASMLGLNTNTVYARVRAARAAFEQGVARHKARDGWRLR
jgi:RNA polymerase sigma-70 factor, ECF subfamily